MHTCDIVYDMKSFSRTCSSQSDVDNLFHNVSSLLKQGGLFVMTLFDPQVLYYKITKKEREMGVKREKSKNPGVIYYGPGYSLDFPYLLPGHRGEFKSFSPQMKFYLQLLDPPQAPGLHPTPSKQHSASSAYAININDIIDSAKRQSLDLIQLMNYNQLLDEYMTVPPLSDTFKALNITPRMKDNTPSMPSQQLTDVFSKRENIQLYNSAVILPLPLFSCISSVCLPLLLQVYQLVPSLRRRDSGIAEESIMHVSHSSITPHSPLTLLFPLRIVTSIYIEIYSWILDHDFMHLRPALFVARLMLVIRVGRIK